MRPRFYLPDVEASGHGVLVEDEASHLTRVLRLGVGAEVFVFDGRGGMFDARVVALERARVHLQIEGPVPAAPEPAVRVTLVMSVLKGDKMDDVVRDAVMMGVHAVQPVVAARSEVSLATLARAHRVERWQRVAVSSVKQCGRATVPAILPPLPLATWLERLPPEMLLVLAEPATGVGSGLAAIRRSEAVQLIVGPEGGWSPDDQAMLAAAGGAFVSLGGRTLRADAVPLVALAALYEAWNGW